MESDPFVCFGTSSDEEEPSEEPRATKTEAKATDVTDGKVTPSSHEEVVRDPSCGVCSFHPHTEASLLAHVRNAILPCNSMHLSAPQTDFRGKLKRSNNVLFAVDNFCMSRHWMMHIGPEKGSILRGALRDALMNKVERHSLTSSNTDFSNDVIPFVAVELGTYCGYASIMMGNEFCASVMTKITTNAQLDFHLFSFEINQEYAKIANEMIKLSDLDDIVSVHEISYDGHSTDVVNAIRDSIQKQFPNKKGPQILTPSKIDFLLIDHDKDSYKSDLCRLEAAGLIGSGTKVVADNVLFAGIVDYSDYVRQIAKQGTVQTKTIPCRVEYCSEAEQKSDGSSLFNDAVEITDYLQDP